MLHYYLEGFFIIKKGSTFNTYSEELKLSAVQSYLNGEWCYNFYKCNWGNPWLIISSYIKSVREKKEASHLLWLLMSGGFLLNKVIVIDKGVCT